MTLSIGCVYPSVGASDAYGVAKLLVRVGVNSKITVAYNAQISIISSNLTGAGVMQNLT